MGFEKLAEEAAGAFAAEKALDAVDPNAGFLAKAAAGVAGFEGGGMLGDMISGLMKPAEQPEAEQPAAEQVADEQAPNDQTGDDQNA